MHPQLPNHVTSGALPTATMPSTASAHLSPWQPTNSIDPDLNITLINDASTTLLNCKYSTQPEVQSLLSASNNHCPFSLMHYNVRGIRSSILSSNTFSPLLNFSLLACVKPCGATTLPNFINSLITPLSTATRSPQPEASPF
jgi:hypothetical protein